MKQFIADANFFLRFLLNDIPLQAKETEKQLCLAKKQKIIIFVPQIIIFEIAFVLSKTYGFSKTKTATALKSLLVSPYLNVESRKVFLEALNIWPQINIDFVDTFLLTLAKHQPLGSEKKKQTNY